VSSGGDAATFVESDFPEMCIDSVRFGHGFLGSRIFCGNGIASKIESIDRSVIGFYPVFPMDHPAVVAAMAIRKTVLGSSYDLTLKPDCR